MDLLVPCIVEGRSELRNVGRVNCKTHWPFSGCGTPYSLNVYIALQIKLRVLTLPAARSVESALLFTRFSVVKKQILQRIYIFFCAYFLICIKFSKFSHMNSVTLFF